jgi:hypothetical protein
MANSSNAALEIALAYHRAWTSRDMDQALTYIADDIVCEAPAGTLEGVDAFRGFMEPFTHILQRAELLDAFGDEQHALVMYDTDTVPVQHAPGAEYVTVNGDKITHMVIVFDRLPFETARQAAPKTSAGQ